MFMNVPETVQLNFSINTKTYEVLNEKCGCSSCDYEVQPGHKFCWPSSKLMLQLEELGIIYRSYQNNKWRWYISGK